MKYIKILTAVLGIIASVVTGFLYITTGNPDSLTHGVLFLLLVGQITDDHK